MLSKKGPEAALTQHNSRLLNDIPSPLSPFLAKRHFSREGGGCIYFEAPSGRNFTHPLFYTPLTRRRVFERCGGWGCIKVGLDIARLEKVGGWRDGVLSLLGVVRFRDCDFAIAATWAENEIVAI